MKLSLSPPIKNVSTLLLAASIAVLASCGKKHEYKVLLTDGDTITTGSGVTIDDTEAGEVINIETTDTGKIATIKIEDKNLADKVMRIGIFRISSGDTIVLRSDEVTEKSESLETNAVIPSKSKLVYQINKYATVPTLITAAVGLIVVLVLILICKAVFTGSVTFACVILAGATSLFLEPMLTPYIEKHLPTTEAAEAVSIPAEDSQPIRVSEVIQNMPKPKIIAYIVVWVASFFVYSLLIGTSLKRLGH
ncbi:hypothetical protein N9496_06880 [Akkermansiaceae bacterium]|nr:hypothetical protein [Akkermansiaceae bacterium]